MPTEFIDTLSRALARGASRRELLRVTGGLALVGFAKSKPPPADKCHGNGSYCGACGGCRKGKCVGDNGLCGACQVCAADGLGVFQRS